MSTDPRGSLDGGSFRRFVALGDSTTEGLVDLYPGGGGYRGWADRLTEMIASRGPGLSYANLAIRGRKMGQIRAEQLEPALELEPDLASVLGGVNDILRPGLDLDRLLGDLEETVSRLRDQGATVLTFTFPDPSMVITVAGARIRARMSSFNDGVRALSEGDGIVLVDLERGGEAHAGHYCSDRLHANAAGHAQIAGAAADALELDPQGLLPPPIPRPPARRRAVRYAADTIWMGRYMTPWLVRRIRGRSSGDGRTAKRPELLPFEPLDRSRQLHRN